MKIAVEGCCHGELDAIYETIGRLEKESNTKIDLLVVCGDFQSVRNHSDLQAMAVPPKYQQLQTFYKYYNKEKTAPVLTIFIGGNHEASNYLQELTYGGWVAPNIYFLGKAGVIQVGGVRIGGISGIYKGHDFMKGHFERPPYTDNSKRSVYHYRNLEVFRLKQLAQNLDVFVSHDWPQGIYYHGDKDGLVRRKPFFKKEVEENTLGSRPLGELLNHMKPAYWFSAHLHVKFAAHVMHPTADSSETQKSTRFLALDKCLPRRQFLQIVDIPHKESEGMKLKLDPEWLTVLRTTNHLLKLSQTMNYMPGPSGSSKERYNFVPTEEEMKETVDIFGGDLTLPENFVQTCPPLHGNPGARGYRAPLDVTVNPQTSLLCTMLELTDPMASFLGKTSEDLLDKVYTDQAQDKSPSDPDSGPDIEEDETSHSELPSFIDDTVMDSPGSSRLNMSLPTPKSEIEESQAVPTTPSGIKGSSLPKPLSTPVKVSPLSLPAPSPLSTPVKVSPLSLPAPSPLSMESPAESLFCTPSTPAKTSSPIHVPEISPSFTTPLKRESPNTNEVSSSLKKLKRRNASAYTEPVV